MTDKALLDGAGVVVIDDYDTQQLNILRRDDHEWRRHNHASPLHCTHCGVAVHLITYSSGLIAFRHDPAPTLTAACAVARGESAQHESTKALIRRGVKRIAGVEVDTEVPGDEIDPETGRPCIVDVVAWRLEERRRHGWEVQLSPMSVGALLDRHERRSYLDCTWVGRQEAAAGWSAAAEAVPTLGLDESLRTVTGGIVHWVDYGGGRGGDYFPAPPEPLADVVGDQMRRGGRALTWAEGTGWHRLAEGQRRQRGRQTESHSRLGRSADCMRNPAPSTGDRRGGGNISLDLERASAVANWTAGDPGGMEELIAVHKRMIEAELGAHEGSIR